MFVSEKEKILLDKIKKAQAQLDSLQEKQRMELGKMAYKHGLHAYPKSIVEASLKKIADELKNEHL